MLRFYSCGSAPFFFFAKIPKARKFHSVIRLRLNKNVLILFSSYFMAE